MLTKENLVGAGQKLLPLQFSGLPLPYSAKPGFLRKDSLLPPRIRWEIGRRWGAGSNRDPDFLASFKGCSCRGQKLNTNFFPQSFRAIRGYPAKSCPKVWFPWVSNGRHLFILKQTVLCKCFWWAYEGVSVIVPMLGWNNKKCKCKSLQMLFLLHQNKKLLQQKCVYTPCRHDSRNTLLGTFVCSHWGLVFCFCVMTPKIIPPEFVYVMANPTSTQKSRISTCISWCSMDYMRIVYWHEDSFPNHFSMYVMFWMGGGRISAGRLSSGSETPRCPQNRLSIRLRFPSFEGFLLILYNLPRFVPDNFFPVALQGKKITCEANITMEMIMLRMFWSLRWAKLPIANR